MSRLTNEINAFAVSRRMLGLNYELDGYNPLYERLTNFLNTKTNETRSKHNDYHERGNKVLYSNLEKDSKTNLDDIEKGLGEELFSRRV